MREKERPKSDILGGDPFYPFRSYSLLFALSFFAGSDKQVRLRAERRRTG